MCLKSEFDRLFQRNVKMFDYDKKFVKTKLKTTALVIDCNESSEIKSFLYQN